MIQKLLMFGFSWNKVDNFTPEKIENVLIQEMLEFNVEYPKELQ